MKLTNEICISFLRGSGWLYNHDKEITISERNKAIDEFCNVLCSNGAIADFMKDYIIEKGKEFKQCHISQ